MLAVDRVPDDNAGADVEIEMGAHRIGQRADVVEPRVDAKAALPRVERGELVGPETQHWNAERFQQLTRSRKIENRLGTGTHNGDRKPRERGHIGRHVSGVGSAPVHAANAAGRDHANAGFVRRHHRCRDRRRSPAAGDKMGREVAQIQLDRVAARGKLRDFVALQTDAEPSVDDADGGRKGALGGDGRLQHGADLDPFRMGKAVRHQCGLERDYGAARGDRVGNRLGDNDIPGRFAHARQAPRVRPGYPVGAESLRKPAVMNHKAHKDHKASW